MDLKARSGDCVRIDFHYREKKKKSAEFALLIVDDRVSAPFEVHHTVNGVLPTLGISRVQTYVKYAFQVY